MVRFCTTDGFQPAVHPACRIVKMGLQSIWSSVNWMNERMNESRYLLMRVCTYLLLAWHIAFGQARLRGERVLSRQSPSLQGVGEIDGDARSRYLLPCEIERRPQLFGRTRSGFSLRAIHKALQVATVKRWKVEFYPLSFRKTTPPYAGTIRMRL